MCIPVCILYVHICTSMDRIEYMHVCMYTHMNMTLFAIELRRVKCCFFCLKIRKELKRVIKKYERYRSNARFASETSIIRRCSVNSPTNNGSQLSKRGTYVNIRSVTSGSTTCFIQSRTTSACERTPPSAIKVLIGSSDSEYNMDRIELQLSERSNNDTPPYDGALTEKDSEGVRL
jgi:hypothetical protein